MYAIILPFNFIISYNASPLRHSPSLYVWK